MFAQCLKPSSTEVYEGCIYQLKIKKGLIYYRPYRSIYDSKPCNTWTKYGNSCTGWVETDITIEFTRENKLDKLI